MEGKRLKLLRVEKELTQEELGKVLGVGKTTISQYESEVRKPDAEMLMRIARYFDVSVDYLLGLSPIKKYKNETEAAHRQDDPMSDLPPEAQKSLDDFKEYILRKYGKKKE